MTRVPFKTRQSQYRMSLNPESKNRDVISFAAYFSVAQAKSNKYI